MNPLKFYVISVETKNTTCYRFLSKTSKKKANDLEYHEMKPHMKQDFICSSHNMRTVTLFVFTDLHQFSQT